MYRAPVAEIAFTLRHVAGLGEAMESGCFPDLTDDIVEAVLTEAGRFATEVLAPLNRVGDREGARFTGGDVATPPGWREAYRDFCAAGWNGISAPEHAGGQGLPLSLAAATQEMWNGAAMAFALCPMLTMGAVEALERHGSEPLKAAWLARIVSGEWTATMNLTEPQAGSDVGAIRTRAEPRSDGSYRLFGQKIFITYGEHDLAGNIVHLVLARLPEAPQGSRGISLFLAPKYLIGPGGGLRERNDLFAAGIERKMGIHGSPTCTMIYGDGRFGAEPGAVGWLVGEAHRGLACMFIMMNNARLMVGIQGVGQAELALQQATAYARQRRQGRVAGWSGEGDAPIAAHPDVRRMLMTMRALTAASRAICYACAVAADLGARPHRAVSGGQMSQADWLARAGLLTPLAKAFATDAGLDVASRGVQVHGGMGFIEETGAAQTLRDARIAPIYEGTNGIQAIDLVTRKLPLSGGAAMRRMIAEMRDVADQARQQNRSDFGRMSERLSDSLDDLEGATAHLLACIEGGKEADVLAGATPFLRLFGLTFGGGLLARGALASAAQAGAEAAFRIATARFAAEQLLPETAGLRLVVTEGSDAVLATDMLLAD